MRPARIFVNRMLALFRANQGAKRIFLTPAFHSDLDWFLSFPPSYNCATFLKKAEIPHLQTLRVDTSLSGLGGVWNKEVYATPIFKVYGSDLKLCIWKCLILSLPLNCGPKDGPITQSSSTATTKPWFKWLTLAKPRMNG